MKIRFVSLLALAGVFAGASASAEVVEEIIAWVNGEIITRSEYEEEQQARLAEVYKALSGEELDREVERTRRELLLSMVDRKILLHHARALGYDMNKMGEAYLKGFMKQQKIADEVELERIAQQDGMTARDVRQRLLELYAPADVVDMEVANRISVSDGEIEAFYAENQSDFHVEGEVTFREIVLLTDGGESPVARRDEALAVRQRILDGEEFSSLAREFSEAGTRDAGGKLGPLKRGELAASLADLTFSLPVGEVAELMETPYGFHIIKVESRIDDHVRSLEDVRETIRKRLQERKFKVDLEVFMQKARRESEWCVAPKHEALLSIEPPPPCELL